MEDLVTWLLDNIPLLLVGAIVGAIATLILTELTRVQRISRLLMGPAMMPSFELTVDDNGVSLRMFGDYGVVNMSELPVSMSRPHLLGYNFASRAFQFKVMPAYDSTGKMFEKISVPSKKETVLISEEAHDITVERYNVRRIPRYVWLETLELVRIASRRSFRDRAYLYRRNFYSPDDGRAWYVFTGKVVSSLRARLMARPGRFLYRRRKKRATQ